MGKVLCGGEETNLAEELLAEGRRFVDAKSYFEAEQILRKALRDEPGLIEARFLLGFALAKQEKWVGAKEALEEVLKCDPHHARAYTELAGVEFRLGNREEAIRNLKRAEKLNPDTEYVHNFLATLFFLEDRKTEALYHWNKVGKPRVDKIAYHASNTIRPDLLRELFTLNEGEIFHRSQLLQIRWKQHRFRLGSPFGWQVTPRAGGNYDLDVILPSGPYQSSPKLLLLKNAIRAPLYREVAVQYPLSLRSGRTIFGSFRWDEPRRRVQVSAGVPFVTSSADRLTLDFDWRDERWKHRFSGNEFPLETRTLLAGYESIFEGRKSLLLRGGYKYQSELFPPSSNLPGDSHFAIIGTRWEQVFSLNASDDLQLHLHANIDGFFGHGSEGSRSEQLKTDLEVRWLMQRTTGTECRFTLGAGYSSTSMPLDSYFILGVGQDNPLPLRAHPTVDQGRKGNSPMGRQFMLANLEIRRRALKWRVLEVGVFAFSDTALVGGAPFEKRGRQWFQDVGFGFRLGALGREYVEVLFGFDAKDSNFNLWLGIPLVCW